MKHHLKEVLISLDQLGNAILGGWSDETFSARTWRLRKRMPYKILHPLIDTLFFFENKHCYKSFMDEKKRTQSPIAER